MELLGTIVRVAVIVAFGVVATIIVNKISSTPKGERAMTALHAVLKIIVIVAVAGILTLFTIAAIVINN